MAYTDSIDNINDNLIPQISDTDITAKISGMIGVLPPLLAPDLFAGDYLTGPQPDDKPIEIPPLDPWTEEEIKQFQSELLDAVFVQFEALIVEMIDLSDAQNSGLTQATFNYIISLNSYFTFEGMLPQPDNFMALSIVEPGDLIWDSLDAINNFKTNFIAYADDEYYAGHSGVPGAPVVGGQLVTDLTALQGGETDVADKKTNDLLAMSDEVTAMNLKIGVEFMFDDKGSVDLPLTKQDLADKIYRDSPVGVGMETFVAIHGLDIPVY